MILTSITVLLDDNLNVQTTYGARQYPTTFVIDPAGVVRYMHLGEMKTEDLNGYVSELGPTAGST